MTSLFSCQRLGSTYRHAGQARILKALTRNSIISRTFGETNLREG
jgi:hypothetical protein